ncbi:hypothetical protein KZ483_25295 [Paenibacillus sp. sptzw28]|uniref:hypothetical protein n=1 Tax=Paenibacillus sp. sptzw28 TaxID=715179 RepID=UPI001C6E8613|nr:hypothetical protein [Paenibacillus sp. sptzw28]QYR21011.1 hypothetical protein KZ483_25295 [Paenibacillus sp. sptzw28]
MLPDLLIECVRRETHGTMKLDPDNMSRLAEFNPLMIQTQSEPSHVLFDLHPDTYVAPIIKEAKTMTIDFTLLRPIAKQEIELLEAMYNNRIYTLYAFAFMFTYEEKGLILLWAKQLASPPAFTREKTNALLEQALELEAEGSYFAFSSVLHPCQVIELFYDKEKIATAVGGHSSVMIIPVEKKWRLQLRKTKKEPEDDFEILRRLLSGYKNEAVYLQNYFQKNDLCIKG